MVLVEPAESSERITTLMTAFRAGNKVSADDLFRILYPELRRMASQHMRRERMGHSWQPTLLVNELYLELMRNGFRMDTTSGTPEEERNRFLGIAGFLMKRLLILHSRPLRNRVNRIELSQVPELHTLTDMESLRDVESLLSGLEEVDPKLRIVVEARVFEGLTTDEIAERLNCSPRSVGTYWNVAKGWLSQRLASQQA